MPLCIGRSRIELVDRVVVRMPHDRHELGRGEEHASWAAYRSAGEINDRDKEGLGGGLNVG
jgi:hypothetical protein